MRVENTKTGSSGDGLRSKYDKRQADAQVGSFTSVDSERYALVSKMIWGVQQQHCAS